MEKNRKWILGGAALLMAVLVFTGIYLWFRPVGQAGPKVLEIQVVFSPGESEEYLISTKEAYLGDALLEAGLVQGERGQYGLFITTVAHVRADRAKSQWWCITKNGEEVTTGADSTPIQDGEHYELTLSVY